MRESTENEEHRPGRESQGASRTVFFFQIRSSLEFAPRQFMKSHRHDSGVPRKPSRYAWRALSANRPSSFCTRLEATGAPSFSPAAPHCFMDEKLIHED